MEEGTTIGGTSAESRDGDTGWQERTWQPPNVLPETEVIRLESLTCPCALQKYNYTNDIMGALQTLSKSGKLQKWGAAVEDLQRRRVQMGELCMGRSPALHAMHERTLQRV